MANGTLVVERSPETGIADARPRPLTKADGAAFDWLMAACGTWLIGGLYLDGWAHIHIPALESFFTPWHAVLYSGYIAGAVTLAVTLRRNRRRGASRWDALPAGYGLSLAGAFIFFFGGLADMVWHSAFGIEIGVEGLISPSHLALALGGGLMITGPLRAGLAHPAGAARPWLDRMPLVVSLTTFLSLLTFFTGYASPYGTMWVAETARSGSGAYLSAGFSGFLIQPAILMGLLLFVLRRQPLPAGAFTALLSINVAAMAIIHDKYLDTGPYPLIAAAVLTGLIGDGLLAWLRPAPERPLAFRAVAFLIPAVQYGFYFAAAMLWARVTWSVHLWTGAIVIAGGVGWLLSFLALAPDRAPASRGLDRAARA
jgi:hypothetical protein